MKLLLDENVSPALASDLNRRNIDTTSIRDRGMNGASDKRVLEYAFDDDRIVVTGNADDFRGLCSAAEMHPGLIVIEAGDREQQKDMLDAAVAHIERLAGHAGVAPGTHMVNRVVEVTIDLACSEYEL